MAIEYRRILVKQSDSPEEEPTIPSTNDHNDGSWLATDIYKGELFINIADDKVFTRTNSGIIELTRSNGTLDGIVTIEVDRTFVLSDANKLIELDGSTDRVWTVPLNSTTAFPIGTQILLARRGLGELDIDAEVGVTLNSKDGNLSINGQYAGASLVKVDTDRWYLFGDLKA